MVDDARAHVGDARRYVAIALPFHIGFNTTLKPGTVLWFWENLIDLLFMADVVLNFRTGFLNGAGQHIVEPWAVAMN